MWWNKNGKSEPRAPEPSVRWPGPGLTKGAGRGEAHGPVKLEGWRLVVLELEVLNPCRHFFEWR